MGLWNNSVRVGGNKTDYSEGTSDPTYIKNFVLWNVLIQTIFIFDDTSGSRTWFPAGLPHTTHLRVMWGLEALVHKTGTPGPKAQDLLHHDSKWNIFDSVCIEAQRPILKLRGRCLKSLGYIILYIWPEGNPYPSRPALFERPMPEIIWIVIGSTRSSAHMILGS